ncbi:hypothetical protein [Aliihoeflea sp. 40Bstr573]|nr:hypothetical protein [Aliihoeflea sp. 40Bstr573]MCO6389350.1 hypothetical protein [Aliihoeflea sp. 40Bstr573]
MIGAAPEEVIVKPKLSLVDATLSPQEAALLSKLCPAAQDCSAYQLKG